MNKQQIALELTKLYIEQQDTVPTKKFIIAVYFNFLNNLESKGEDEMNKEEITLEQAEDIVDNMYQQRFKECKVDDENKVHIDNVDNVTFNKLEKASISLLRTEISQKSEIERLNGIIDELEKWLQENIRISKAHGNQTAVNIFNAFLDKLKELKGDDING